MDFSPAHKMCSFCGKQGTRRSEFIGGLGAMICTDCIEHFHDRLQSPAGKRQMRQPPWDEMSNAELLDVLPQILRSADQVNLFASQWVELIRERGISWAAIGNVLGVSRQAVWERFGHRNAERHAKRDA